jgi:cobalt-zinc-cadmium efflux system outer membrane protein
MLKGTYDLLEAKQHEIEAERSSIEASRDYWVARAALERAVGGSLNPVALHVTKANVNAKPHN